MSATSTTWGTEIRIDRRDIGWRGDHTQAAIDDHLALRVAEAICKAGDLGYHGNITVTKRPHPKGPYLEWEMIVEE